MGKSEYFMIKARKCKRCGRLLTSEQAVRDGYGPRCKCNAKIEDEQKEPIPGQMTLFDYQNIIDK